MDVIINPCRLAGSVPAIPSKSQAHRLLICSAFADGETDLLCPSVNRDIEATAACLNAIGAKVLRTDRGYTVSPVAELPGTAVLPCGESGSTLRFLLPVVGALGIDAVFIMKGRLPDRPLSPLWELMEEKGCHLSRPTADTIRCSGKLTPGDYSIAGDVSSQFISGLLFAAPLMDGNSNIRIIGKAESAPYIEMTRRALKIFRIDTKDFSVSGKQKFHSPGNVAVEGDWSNGAFFLAANAIGNRVTVTGLDDSSPQGDRAVAGLLQKLHDFCTIDISQIPDLMPILAVTAGANQGCLFENVRRLRLKESDRVATVSEMLERFGVKTEATENTLRIFPGQFHGCTVDPHNDHRIAMAAAVGATLCKEPVIITGAECTDKSYPSFWDIYRQLGGNYEQYIR